MDSAVRSARSSPLHRAAPPASVFCRGADAAIYTPLAAAGSHSLGIALEVLGRWVFGSGSAAEAVGAAVRSVCYLVILRLIPDNAPLLLMRIIERAKFDRRERKKKKRREKKEGEHAKFDRQERTGDSSRVGSTEEEGEGRGNAGRTCSWVLRNCSLVNLDENARPGPAATSRRCSFRALFAGASSSLGRFLASTLRAQEGCVASISR
ncbi:hypothetical protein PR202_ga09250 [Eleusine coracana subsp. coracana]|uniref:Uncharacterized protein n=1 Tax=Eleusine coracana subsp. coracana TaxID=191504 RepID=A0AAV5C4C4_ELECO|nr:hypothetical protein PR202_ga09250 [Eleusine coracana subsp. coracana]